MWAPLRIFMSIAFFNHSISETQTGYNLTKTLYNGPETITFTNPIGRIKSYTKGAPNIYKKKQTQKNTTKCKQKCYDSLSPRSLTFLQLPLSTTDEFYLSQFCTHRCFFLNSNRCPGKPPFRIRGPKNIA